MTRRDLLTAAAFGLVVLATVPAFDRAFDDTAWRVPVLASAAVVAIAVIGLRAVRTPWPLALPLGAGAVVASATALLLVEDPGWWPSRERLEALVTLGREGAIELAVTPAPAPSLAGLVLLTGVGVLLVTWIGLELAVRWRRPGLAMIGVTALWAVPLAVPLDPAPGSASVRAAVYLGAAAVLLLVAPPRRDRAAAGTAGGAVSTPPPRGTAWHASARSTPAPAPATGAVMAMAAVVLAVTSPGLLPGHQAASWVELGQGGQPRGYQPIVDVSQRLRSPEERDLLRVLSPRRTYLRLAGLDSFDGATWRLGPGTEGSFRPDPSRLFAATDTLPPEQPAAVTEPLAVDIEVLDLDNIYVPTPYQPTQVLGPEREDMVWSTEGGFLATWETDERRGNDGPRVGIREGVRYRVQAERPTPTRELLAAVDTDDPALARYTALPRPYPELAEQAEAIYAAAGATTTIDRALALQDWFVGPAGGFTYDLDVPALQGERALEQFVLEDRVGYCEYYATAMAVMLRATGIPARVAVGFLPGRVTAEPDPSEPSSLTEFTVSSADAHAWVEVLFPGYGWITFEPTPRDDQSQIVPRADVLAPWENERERLEREATQSEDPADTDPAEPEQPAEVPDLEQLLPEEFAAEQSEQGGSASATSGTRRWLVAAGAALAIVLLLMLLPTARRYPRGGDPRRRVLAAQRHLLEQAQALGAPRRRHETILETVTRWSVEGRLGEDDDGHRFAALAQAAAFGATVDEADAGEAVAIADALIAGLRATSPTRRRLLAPAIGTLATLRPWQRTRQDDDGHAQRTPDRVTASTARR